MNEAERNNPKKSRQPVATLPGSFALTDLGNCERLVAQFRDRIRYNPQRRKWLTWSGTRWEWDETGEVERLAKEAVRQIYVEASKCSDNEMRRETSLHARRSEAAGRLHAMVSLAQSERGIPVLVRELDVDAWLLNCANGTVDLRTATIRPHAQRDMITRTTGVDFDASAKSELWERVLNDATGGDIELARYLQRVAGYALIGTPLERAFFFVYGPPGTSKSTLVRALHVALGDYAVSTAFETFCVQTSTGGNRGDLVRLAGARLVSSVEVRKGAKWDEAIVKAITGGDELVAAAKYESEVAFFPSCTLIFAANDSPAARDDDEGLWVRMRRIPFTAVIPKERQERDLKERLAESEHARAILAWAVAGCLAYQRDGLAEPLAVQESTAAYRAEQDRFADFVADCLVLEADASVTRLQLRKQYEDWGKEVGARTLLGAREIAQRLRERGCVEAKVRGSRQWRGVRLRDASDGEGALDDEGALGSTIPRKYSYEFSYERVSGTGDPKCPLPPRFEDEGDERLAIQIEGAGQ